MHVEILGAAQEVTGACFLLRAGRYRVLIDCGLIQGGYADELRNHRPFPFAPAEIDAVVLSHAHLDHSGRLPLLVKSGFRGSIFTQSATRDLARIMLRDAAFINEKESEWSNRKRDRKGLKHISPLYTIPDAQAAVRRMRAIPYARPTEILPGIAVTLHDAGHILGSAIVEMRCSAEGCTRTLVYSGDLGHHGAPILRDPARVAFADLLLLETTYGDRCHRDWDATWRELGDILRHAHRSGGNILIPAFAVGRTQELLYAIKRHQHEWQMDHWSIFLDSPLAIEATNIYAQHAALYDAEANRMRHNGDPFSPAHFRACKTAAQSMALNRISSGAMIIAGSGMCTGGRIKHHLKHHLWRDNCHIIISGFQAQGTLGRRLVDGARFVRLWGETIKVAAHIHTVGGLSAHADQRGLLDWLGGFKTLPRIALVHGETQSLEALRGAIQTSYKTVAMIPAAGETLAL